MALGAITRRRCHLIDMPAANQGSSPLQSAAQAEQTAVYLLTHLDQVPHYILAKRYEELACFADYLHADVPPVLAQTDQALYRTLRRAVTEAHVAGYGRMDGANIRAIAATMCREIKSD
jgi:hypothetical protein